MRDLLSIGTSRGCEMIGTGIGLGLSGFRVNPPGFPATLDLNFASSLSLTSSSGITPSFSRASTGTFFNSSGVLTTAAVNGPRFNHVYNGSSWVSKGLLVEEQRTNLALYSQDFTNIYWTKTAPVTLTADDRVAPDGTQTGTKVVFTAVNQEVYKSVSLSGTPYTISLWVYGTNGETITLFDGNTVVLTTLTGTWQRLVTTSSNTTHFDFGTFAGSTARTVWIWGAQLESGSFPTSYIPTTTAAVTRSADVCEITGGDFSGFWNASEGSVAAEWDRIFNDTSGEKNAVWFAQNSSSPGSITMGHELYNGSEYFLSQADVALSATAPAAQTLGKSAVGYKLNNFGFSVNGAAVLTDTSSTVPTTVDRLVVGNQGGYSVYLNGHIARLRYYNTRLTDSQLQGLTL